LKKIYQIFAAAPRDCGKFFSGKDEKNFQEKNERMNFSFFDYSCLSHWTSVQKLI